MNRGTPSQNRLIEVFLSAIQSSILASAPALFLASCGSPPPETHPPLPVAASEHSTILPYYPAQNLIFRENTFFLWKSPELANSPPIERTSEKIQNSQIRFNQLQAHILDLEEKAQADPLDEWTAQALTQSKIELNRIRGEYLQLIESIKKWVEWFDHQPETIQFQFVNASKIEASVQGWSAHSEALPSTCSTDNGQVSEVQYLPQGGIFRFRIKPTGSEPYLVSIHRRPHLGPAGRILFVGDLIRIEADGSQTQGVALLAGQTDTSQSF